MLVVSGAFLRVTGASAELDPTELLNSCAIGDLMRARLALATLVLSTFQLFAKVASPQETPVCMHRLDAQTRSCKEKYSEVVVVTSGIPVASASISDSTFVPFVKNFLRPNASRCQKMTDDRKT